MRVITGTARGRRLKTPPGLDTRPTTDKVKESIFNIIQFDIEGRRVLDLFAGCGQMGIEALSRGAEHCTFVEMRRDASAVVRENLAVCQLEAQGSVKQMDAPAYLQSCREKFDLVFLDPPYEGELLAQALNLITLIDIVSEHGIIICEISSEGKRPKLAEPYAIVKEYKYGKTTILRIERNAQA